MSELHEYISDLRSLTAELALCKSETERRVLRRNLHDFVTEWEGVFTPEQIALGWAMSLEEENA